MAVFSVEGKLGTGKTKFCVWRARDALREGRRVASNVDLYLAGLGLPAASSYVRIPDKPTALDLEAMGHGNPDSYDEDRNGILILDELGSWLNSRSFQDKGRAALLDWLIHARKLGWDVYLIVQDAMMIDKQVREALIEYKCRCMRFDRVRIPLVGGMLQDLGSLFGAKRAGYLPRMHSVAARVGEGTSAIVAERWQYRGDDLHAGYDTRQVFRSDYPHGAHSVLHPDRFAPPVVRPGFLRRLASLLTGGTRQRAPVSTARPARAAPPGRVVRPRLRAVALAAALPADDAWRLARRYVARLELVGAKP